MEMMARGPHNFAPERRVKRRGEYLKIQGEGRKVRSRFFVIAYTPRQGAAECRLGVTITTKVHKRAVKRNRLRRRVREIFRRNCETLPFPADIVVIALNGSTELEYAEVERELCYLYRKAKRSEA